MGRLIDVDAFLKNLINCDIGRKSLEKVIELVKEQPTAYDPDKVVEQLEKKIQTHKRGAEYERKNGTITEEFQQRKAVEVLKDAIEIVKAGGVDA